MRKGKDPDPDQYLWLVDLDPGGPKTCGSGSPTLVKKRFICQKRFWSTLGSGSGHDYSGSGSALTKKFRIRPHHKVHWYFPVAIRGTELTRTKYSCQFVLFRLGCNKELPSLKYVRSVSTSWLIDRLIDRLSLSWQEAGLHCHSFLLLHSHTPASH
jgi:hypothetical protein